MDIDFAPTGREFVTGSYDRTIRLFPINAGKSREVYHGQRMQKFYKISFFMEFGIIFFYKSFCSLLQS